MNGISLILASSSPRRLELLRSMGVAFEVMASRAEELHDESVPAAQLCEINAQRKAAEVAARREAGIILGADTLVTLNGRIFGKPHDLTKAKVMLRALSGQSHEVVTGLCLIDRESGRRSLFHDTTRVTFKALTDDVIENYIASVPVLDKAGSYGIQERGELLVQGMSGSFSNVVGLPLERLAKEFDAWGINYNWRNR